MASKWPINLSETAGVICKTSTTKLYMTRSSKERLNSVIMARNLTREACQSSASTNHALFSPSRRWSVHPKIAIEALHNVQKKLITLFRMYLFRRQPEPCWATVCLLLAMFSAVLLRFLLSIDEPLAPLGSVSCCQLAHNWEDLSHVRVLRQNS